MAFDETGSGKEVGVRTESGDRDPDIVQRPRQTAGTAASRLEGDHQHAGGEAGTGMGEE